MAKSRHHKKVYEGKATKWERGARIFQLLLSLLLFVFIGTVAVFLYVAKDLPRPEKFSELILLQSTKIYDRSGTVLLYEVSGEEKREVIPLSEIPEHLKRAILATEDAEFYSHFGISFKGTARAVLINLGLRPSQNRAQGGSTITQQLARTSFLTREKTLVRKIREFVLTIELERRYSKDQILEFYLNQIPFGANIYGVRSAAEFYFNKEPKELDLAQAATLAALIQAPSYYSPHGSHKEELLLRKNYVLKRMLTEGFVSDEEVGPAKQQDVVFKEPTLPIRAPHLVLHVLDYLKETYGQDFLDENGLRIFTSLDWDLQQIAQQAVTEFAERNKAFFAHNAALVAIDPITGEVLAMVGSKDWLGTPYPEGCTPGKNCLFDPKFNVATALPGRQPGSAFKPFVYATAFQKGYDDKTMVADEQTNFGVWGGKEYIPQNYDGRFRGPVTLRQALAQSLNIPSIKVLMEFAGIEDSIQTARTMGITTLKNASFYGPALVLGGGEVHLLDLVSAYGVFATNGRRIPPVTILKIQDARGSLLYENRTSPIQVLQPGVAQLITNILSDNEARTPVFGPRSPLVIPGYSVAAKTGTTQEFKDGWAIGYTKNLVAGVWAGNNDGTLMHREPGVVVASPIWNRFMGKALSHIQSKKSN